MPPLFISYRRLDGGDDVIELARLLRFRGVRVWRDLDDLTRGQPTETEIRQAIQNSCGGATCYITPGFLESPFIQRVEVPELLKRLRATQRTFPVIPIFMGVPPEELRSRFSDGEVLAACGGEFVPQDAPVTIRSQALRTASKAILKALFLDVYSGIKETRRPVRIALGTRLGVPDHQEDLFLDWRAAFPEQGPARSEGWQELLLALGDVKTILSDVIGPCAIALSGNAHLSAALAVGYTFSLPTGFSFMIAQSGENGESVPWSSRGSSTSADMDAQELPGNVESDDALVLVNISRDLSADVNSWLNGPTHRSFRCRLYLQPHGTAPSRSFVRDDSHARGIAKFVAECIIELRSRVGRIHLLIAAPWSVAVFIGQYLNACGPIQVHEHDKTLGTYTAACLL